MVTYVLSYTVLKKNNKKNNRVFLKIGLAQRKNSVHVRRERKREAREKKGFFLMPLPSLGSLSVFTLAPVMFDCSRVLAA